MKKQIMVLSCLLFLGIVACQNVEHQEQPESIVEEFDDSKYRVLEVSPCDLSGDREPNVKVDVGFGDREYWAYTNEYGQLIRVEAKEIILQDEKTEPVTKDGRYCKDEAKVPGTERPDLDQGHIVADSLGGGSCSYNITPQDSTLNRHGDQAYMEKNIRDAGGCTDFVAIITYPDTKTQIPCHYKYTYVLNGVTCVDEFDNVNPDEYNKEHIKESPASDTVDKVVWVSKNGTKYHSNPHCSHMRNAKPMSKTMAEDRSYLPCEICY